MVPGFFHKCPTLGQACLKGEFTPPAWALVVIFPSVDFCISFFFCLTHGWVSYYLVTSSSEAFLCFWKAATKASSILPAAAPSVVSPVWLPIQCREGGVVPMVLHPSFKVASRTFTQALTMQTQTKCNNLLFFWCGEKKVKGVRHRSTKVRQRCISTRPSRATVTG